MTVYLAGIAPSGRRIMKQSLNNFARLMTGRRDADPRDLDWSGIDRQHVARARKAWATRYAPAGVRVRFAAVKGALRTALQLGILDAGQYQRATDFPAVPPDSMALKPPTAAPAACAALFKTCDVDLTPTGARAGALLALAHAGLRVGELVALDVDDYARASSSGPAWVRVRSRDGRRCRTAHLEAHQVARLERWLAVRGPTPGAVLCRIQGAEVLIGVRMNGAGPLYAFKQCAAAAGVVGLTLKDVRGAALYDDADCREVAYTRRRALAEQLRALRRARRLTHRTLAAQLAMMTPAMVAAAERGVKWVRPDHLRELARFYGVAPWLLLVAGGYLTRADLREAITAQRSTQADDGA